MESNQYISVRRGGRMEYPYQVVLCSPSGRARGIYRVMIAEAKEWQKAVDAANLLSVKRGVPFRLWRTE